jgi:electron transfer flavoprotein beta subunit
VAPRLNEDPGRLQARRRLQRAHPGQAGRFRRGHRRRQAVANPFDDIALEEALRLRDKGIATEVVVATIGPADAQRICAPASRWARTAPSTWSRPMPIQPLTAARVLLKLVEKEQPFLVILGKQAIDDDASQTGRCWPRSGAGRRPPSPRRSKSTATRPRVTREVDAGLETLEVDLPAVITTDLRLNEPRFIKLPDIMKAKSKPLETLDARLARRRVRRHLKTVHYAPPAKRSQGRDGEGRGRTGRRAEVQEGRCCKEPAHEEENEQRI